MDGVKPNLEKIKALKDFLERKTTKHIKQFLELASYYRRFIKDFSKKHLHFKNNSAAPVHFYSPIIPGHFWHMRAALSIMQNVTIAQRRKKYLHLYRV